MIFQFILNKLKRQSQKKHDVFEQSRVDITWQNRKNLPFFSEKVTVIYCDNNKIQALQHLPSSLTFFSCSFNKITKLENLPTNIYFLICADNKLTKIENLPKNLRHLLCMNNKITKIENLPITLESFHYSGNPIQFVDNIPITWFRNGFNLAWYNFIKKWQLRVKFKVSRNSAATIIQRGCENWLYKPYCKDKTIGISVRISLKALGLNKN